MRKSGYKCNLNFIDMKTQQTFRYPMKKPDIYKSEHETFLPGNIAKRGVIGRISRKAISPLAKSMNSHKLQIRGFLLFLKTLLYFPVQVAGKKFRPGTRNIYPGLPIRQWLQTKPASPGPILISGSKILK